MLMVSMDTVDVTVPDLGTNDVATIHKLGPRYFNIDAVQQIYSYQRQPKQGHVSVVVLGSGSFLAEGTPPEVAKMLTKLKNKARFLQDAHSPE